MSNASAGSSVYVAYAREDRARVAPIVAALRAQGAPINIDEERAHGGGSYIHESQQALGQAFALIVFVSAAALRSPWVEAETRAFQAQMARGGARRLIPVTLDETPLPLALAHYQAVNGAGDPNAVAATVLGALGATDAAPAPGAAAPDTSDFGQPPVAKGVIDPITDGWTSLGPPEVERSAPPAPGETTGPPILHDTGSLTLHEPPPVPPFVAAPPAATPQEPAPYITPPRAMPPAIGGPLPPVAPPPEPDAAYGAPAPITGSGASAPSGTSFEHTVTGRSAGAEVKQVTFTAYHPRELQTQQWQPLIVYLSLDNPATLAQVQAAAAERLAGRLNQFRAARSDRSAQMRRGTPLRIVPDAPGIRFNPSHLDVTWLEDVQQHEFRMRAEQAQPGHAVNGVVQIFQGWVLRAEIPISLFVGQAAAHLDSPDAYAQAMARAYRHVFASYSHQDTPVVQSCESAARAMGDEYLRDVNLLQSGQQWDPRLIQAINDADIFQLFWSKRAAASPNVEREWRHALMLLPARPNFIRPVYWTRKLYTAPPELSALHFQTLDLSSLGWGALRKSWYNMRNG